MKEFTYCRMIRRRLIPLVLLMLLLMVSHRNLKTNGAPAAPPRFPQARCTSSYDPLIAQAAARYGISADFMCRIINADTGPGVPRLPQAANAATLGVRNPSDPNQVVPAIAKLLSNYLQKFGSERLAAAAYIAGPEAVQKYHDVPPYKDAKPFVEQVMAGASQSSASIVLKLIDIQRDPPCSTWGDITSCAPNGGAITWSGSYNTTYTWTQPPNEIGPGGTSITLSVSQSNPPERRAATGLRMTGNGFSFSPKNADVAVGNTGQPLSGSASVNVKPPDNPSGDYYLKIGVYYGPAFVYHYRAERSSNSSSNTKEPTARAGGVGFNEVRVVGLTEDAQYHKAGSAAGAWLPVERDTILKAGDEITTGPDGSLTLAFKDSGTVVLKNATQLKIATFFTEGGIVRTEILLKMGEVQSKIDKEFQDKIPKSDFRIKTPTDVDSVRGTVFTVRYDPQTQTTTTMVEEGVVQVTPTNTALSPVTLNANEQVQVARNRVGKVTPVVDEATRNQRQEAERKQLLGNLQETIDRLRASDSKIGGGSTASSAVAGRWSGSWTNSKGESGQSIININDSAGTITGDENGWKIENGRRSGNVLTWQYRNQSNGCRDYTVQFEISADGSTANGTYSATDRCERKSYTGAYKNYRRS